ncbi:LamG-like jellyroll fold domain-containing protein [Carboxylicivirga linearis]|uniref:Alginate lyase family protein n=1 Tax=Carboxylicivirga linearis TaxID=1628157 RepID=A0ABS5JUX4_9BACT|nr:LamG-like jellyroll fold domain-containing protein [Carboxylicivirga linearis]MBS2098706.1 alginate lyase family protein [Carboxylicivirga linearis]
MKKSTFINILILILLSGQIVAQGFKHPGMLHTEEDFVRINEQLAANNPAVVAGYNNLKNNEWSQSDVATWPVEVIKRGVTGDENYINAARGAHAAYLNALRWKISGDVAHANRAVYILNSWASVTKDVTGNTNMSLASGLYGYEFANAAELMRDYEGWDPDDFKAFQLWMQRVWYPKCYDFLSRRHDTWANGTPGHYWSNWGLCNVLAIMSIGVLCDDEFIYNQGVAFYKYDKVGTFKEDPSLTNVDNWGLTEFIGNLVPVVHEDDRGPLGYLGQMQESGRDQGHTMMAVGLAVDICEIAWNQGDDLYGYMDDRLLAGIEFVAAYNTGVDDVPWTDYWYHDVRTDYWNSWRQTGPNGGSRGQFRPFWDRILGHYEGRKGIALNYAHDMADMVVADDGAWGGTSGGYDHLGFTTLTCTRPAITEADAPITLGASILYDGVTYNQGELNNVTPGSQLTLMPLLPDGETDTGNWLWSNGSTSKDLQIEANNSGLYRVTYTNANGVESTQMFSISMHGDCLPDQYFYSITTDDGVVNDSVVTVNQNSNVIISVWASSWHSSYEWNTGETTSSKEVTVNTNDTVISVTGTNMGGAESVINFHINVKPIGPAYQVGEAAIVYSPKVLVVAGQSVTLMPTLKEGIEGGTWQWSTGETSQNIVLNDVQEERGITVTYSIDGTDYSLNYSIVLVPSENAFAYYPMDEEEGNTVIDVWAGNDANLNTCSYTGMGANNSAVWLDGNSESYLHLPNNLVSNLNDFTIAVWIKPDELNDWCRVWDFGNNTNYNMFLTPKANDGYIRFAIKAGGSEQQITTTKALQANKWTHLVVTKSGNTAKLYVNGVEAGSNSSMTINPSDMGYTAQNYVGKSQWPDPLFIGTIDELKIYRASMTHTEVVEIMEEVKPFYAGYKLDAGDLVNDSVISVLAGQSVELIPTFKPGMVMTSGSWLWSDGNTTQNHVFENVQESSQITVAYTYKGVSYNQTFYLNLSEDVTSTYLNNPGFDINCNYTETTGTGSNLGPGYGAAETIEGWTRVQDGEWVAASTFEYGYLGTLNGISIPSAGSDGAVGSGAGALGITAGWTGSAVYYQNVTLPAGSYNLEYAVYNANSATQGECLAGWIPQSGTAVLSSKTSFGYGIWESEIVTFTLDEETSGKIQVGMQSENAGTGDHAKIFFDYVNLKVFNDQPTNIPANDRKESGISIYPTASANNFTLKTTGEKAIVRVYDLAGNLVQQWSAFEAETTFTLPVSQLYIVNVSTQTATETFKIIKN